MKKRIISFVLVLCILLVAMMGLSSCEHECTFDGGRVTVEPTPVSEGERTYTCVICDKTRTEIEVFNGLTEQRWQEATKDAIFLSITISQNGSKRVAGNEITPTEQIDAIIFKLTDNKILEAGTITSNTEVSTLSNIYEGEQMLFKRSDITSVIKVIVSKRDAFEYSKENNVYTAKEAISATTLLDDKKATLTVTNCTLEMTNDAKLSKIICDYTISTEDLSKAVSASYVWEFSAHDTTVIE